MDSVISDIKTLVRIVGRDGAIAALESSKNFKADQLLEVARSSGLPSGTKDSKKKLATAIVRHADKRITRSIDELKSMDKDQLIEYFESIQCDQDELIELLDKIDLKARFKSLRALVEFAAAQIQSLGIYERIADRNGKARQTNTTNRGERI